MEKTNDVVESPDMEMNFADALDEYLNSDFGDLDEGTIVAGEVVKVDKDYVLVDVNFKSEGRFPSWNSPRLTALSQSRSVRRSMFSSPARMKPKAPSTCPVTRPSGCSF